MLKRISSSFHNRCNVLLGCPFSRPAIIRCLIRLRFITGFFWVGGGGEVMLLLPTIFFLSMILYEFFCRGLAGLHDSLRHTMLAVSLGQAIEVICFFSHAMFSSVTRSRIFFLQSRDVRCFSFSSIVYMSSPIKNVHLNADRDAVMLLTENTDPRQPARPHNLSLC